MHRKPVLLLLLSILVLAEACSLFKPLEESPPASSGGNPGTTAEARLRRDVADYARQFIGTTYTYAGKTPQSGFDCSGFTSYVLRHFDVTLSPSSREQEKQGKKIRVEDARPGDLIFFRRTPLGSVFHVSLVVANGPDGLTVIHSVSRGVVEENISRSSYWRDMIPSARNVIGN